MGRTNLRSKSGSMSLGILMSGTGSNAEKIIEAYLHQRDAGQVKFKPVIICSDNFECNARVIAHDRYRGHGLQIPLLVNPRAAFLQSLPEGMDKELKRATYDQVLAEALIGHNVEVVVLAGYEWRVTAPIYNRFLTINVHPGDLRKKELSRVPLYTGLGWEPTAKAILNGENEVRSSVHIATEKVDQGQILMVSQPLLIPEEIARMSLEDRMCLLGEVAAPCYIPEEGRRLSLLVRKINAHLKKHAGMDEGEIRKRIPIYGIAKDIQIRLKIEGDWKIFPTALEYLADGRFERDDEIGLCLDGNPIPNGYEMPLAA